MKVIKIAHGNGGVESNELINKVFLKHLGEFFVNNGEDGGVVALNFENLNSVNSQNGVKIASSTDSYVISPIFFNGGNIGKLCVCGSANDVAMMGAKPAFLTLGFILEEGFSIDELEKIVISIAQECKKGGLKILSADTKVVARGAADKIFINSSALGVVQYENLSAHNLKAGDVIIVSGNVGTHGSMVYCTRNEINLQSALESDCAQLYAMLENLFLDSEMRGHLHALRDATRGGLAAVLNEWAQTSGVNIELQEASIPVLESVRGVCEILGLEAYALANEGVCVLAVDSEIAPKVLEILRAHELGANAQIIGRVDSVCDDGADRARVILQNEYGGKRFLEMPQGELLPRIC